MKLYFMSFDGEIKREAESDDRELLDYIVSNIGSKWYFYPWPVITDDENNIVAMYGIWTNIKTGISFLETQTKGKQLSEVREIFKELSNDPQNEGMTMELFEEAVLDLLSE